MTKKMAKEKRVGDILDAAVTEFLAKGYEGASIDAIAKRAGVSKGGFYHYFPNKEILLMEANRTLSEPVEKVMEDAWSAENAQLGMSSYIRSYLKYWASHPKELSFFFLSMSKAVESEVLMAYYKEYVKAATDFFTGMFLKIAESGKVKISDPEASALSLMGALDGILVYFIVHPEEDVDLLAERLEKIWIG